MLPAGGGSYAKGPTVLACACPGMGPASRESGLPVLAWLGSWSGCSTGPSSSLLLGPYEPNISVGEGFIRQDVVTDMQIALGRGDTQMTVP